MGRPCDCTEDTLCKFCHEWTDEAPTKPGWYWITYRKFSNYPWHTITEKYTEWQNNMLLDSHGDPWSYWEKYEAKRSTEPLRVPEFKQE